MIPWIVGIGAYVLASIAVTARLAYLIGQHRGMHIRSKDVYPMFLTEDGRSKECQHRYCDEAEVPIMYFFSLFLLPVFLLFVGIIKFVKYIQRGGFNSVQLPANASSGIEITEIRLSKPRSTFWANFWFILGALVFSATFLYCCKNFLNH